MNQILQYLEDAYTGARMNDDLDAMVRIARAIEAFKLPTDLDCVIQSKPIIELEITEEIIKCKNCKYAHMTYSGECKYCDMWDESLYVPGDFFCAFAELKKVMVYPQVEGITPTVVKRKP